MELNTENGNTSPTVPEEDLRQREWHLIEAPARFTYITSALNPLQL